MTTTTRDDAPRSWARRLAGVATSAVAGALVLAVGASQAAPEPSPVVSLTTSSSVQSAIDDLLDAMQQAVAHDLALPYADPGSADNLLTILQNTNYQLLMSGISRVTELFDGWFFQSPEVVAGSAADPRQYFNFFTPDIYYHVTAGLAPGATYELTGTLGGGTEDFSISTELITGGSADTTGSLELGNDLVVNPDGTFTVVIGPTDPGDAANFMNDTSATASGAASLLIRDMLGDWAKGPGNVAIHCVADCPPFFAIPEGGLLPGGFDSSDSGTDPLAGLAETNSIDSLLTKLFSAFAAITGPFNELGMENGAVAGINEPVNTMGNIAPETSFGAGLEDARVSAGNFDLDAGEALIVKVPNVSSAYSGIELMNVYGAALPYTMAQTTLNNTTAFHDPDGYTYYVVSDTNPGVANWLDSSGVTRGEIFARFENVADGEQATGLPVMTEVVPVDEVSQYLPTDTPTVTPEEYAADMAQRVMSYDYALDVSRMHAQPSWLIQELLLHEMKVLVGEDNYDAVFGAEPVTPLALRFTDALSPDWDAVTNDLFTHPVESLTAIVNNLQLAWSDVSLPVELALAQTALAVFAPQTLGSVLNDALFDPTTSITAGLLNARDDLATAILTANGGFPTELGQEATLEWAQMSDLISAVDAGMNPADWVASMLEAG